MPEIKTDEFTTLVTVRQGHYRSLTGQKRWRRMSTAGGPGRVQRALADVRALHYGGSGAVGAAVFALIGFRPFGGVTSLLVGVGVVLTIGAAWFVNAILVDHADDKATRSLPAEAVEAYEDYRTALQALQEGPLDLYLTVKGYEEDVEEAIATVAAGLSSGAVRHAIGTLTAIGASATALMRLEERRAAIRETPHDPLPIEAVTPDPVDLSEMNRQGRHLSETTEVLAHVMGVDVPEIRMAEPAQTETPEVCTRCESPTPSAACWNCAVEDDF